ncbi:UvrD-helicase domain-containing protein [Actinocrispum wychmicini]|uniref:UvrD-like helicase family protein n=1 Tax=Actinocrispum wychmicini TaxID=1213861 RepID=A0A4R2JEZ1_9PSEU|nr:UvrD-helicase domain-containing protein [Actinocrispum wychmicini]TCO58273.1 UvrD-like helicase family protein [Actinocrispum wychmicini]
MPRLAFTNTFWETYDLLEKQAKAGVRRAMAKFQQLSVAELYADKGLHLESVEASRDPRMRTIRITNFWRGVVLAPDDGSDIFLLLSVVTHDDAYAWAAKRLYTVNTATHALEVRNVVAIEQLTPPLEQAAAGAPELLFERHSDSVLRELGIDDQVLRAARAITDKPQLQAFSSLLPEDQFEVLQFLAEGFSADEVYRDVVTARKPAQAAAVSDSLAIAITNTASRITLVSTPDELAEILEKPFAAWRVFLHPSQRRLAYRTSFNGAAQVTGGPGTGKTVVALHRVKHLLSRSPHSRVLLTTFTNALAELRATGRTTHLQIGADAARLLSTPDGHAHQFDHVVVDEAQDLRPAQWRVLRAAVPAGPDDLFITGDPHQRIYDSRVSLRALGISVTGRSSRLRVNYRSTAEILEWSARVIDGSPVEDLGGDGNDNLAGYRSLLHGHRPETAGFPTEQAEVAALGERIRGWISQGVEPGEIAVCTRFNILLDKVHSRLRDNGIPVVRLKDMWMVYASRACMP